MNTFQFHLIVKIWIGIALIMIPVLLSITAPYGRHSRRDWGPMIPNRMGWIIMELPSLIMFITFFLTGPNQMSIPLLIFFLLYVIHYTNRSIIFPLRTHTSRKLMPLLIVVLAIFFNLINGFLNGFYFGSVTQGYSLEWLYDIRFILGFLIFLSGMIINLKYDNMLLALRKSSRNGYAIPTGGLFNIVSCPNFFFLAWTMVNLIPRALDHHKWYLDRFENYPAERKALIPYLL